VVDLTKKISSWKLAWTGLNYLELV
jgi:hypothetical protein